MTNTPAPRKRARNTAARKTTEKPAAKKTAKKPTAPKVMALKVRRMSLGDIHDHPRNKDVRKHPEPGSADWDVLATSLTYDYFDPLVWNERNGQLVSGHLRRKVMVSMGITHADVVEVDYDEPTHIARLLAANNLIGNDDRRGMKVFLSELQGTKKFDMSLTGFSYDTLKSKFDLSPPHKKGGTKGKGEEGDSETARGQESEEAFKGPHGEVGLVFSLSPEDHQTACVLLRELRKQETKEQKEPPTRGEILLKALNGLKL